MSEPPAAAKGTIMRTGLTGYAAGCAACALVAATHTTPQHSRTNMELVSAANYFNTGSGGGVPAGSGCLSTFNIIDTSV
jgi:hypothetical protein